MEHLVRSLNSAANQGQPAVIYELQKQIQQLQADSSAWQGSFDLLDTGDSLLQFYGALTLNIKVHADWDKDKIGQDRTTVHQLIQQALTRYTALSRTTGADVVLSKLAATLAAIFAKANSAWAYPCRHALACAVAGQYVEQSAAPEVQELLSSKSAISASAFKAVVVLASAMCETNTSLSNTALGHSLQVRLSNNLTDVWMLIHFCLVRYRDLEVQQLTQSQHQPNSNTSHATGLVVDLSDHTDRAGLFELVIEMIPSWAPFMDQGSLDTPFYAFQTVIQLCLDFLDRAHQIVACMSCMTMLNDEHYTLLRSAERLYSKRINQSAAATKCTQDCLDGIFSAEASAYVEFLGSRLYKIDTTEPSYLDEQDNIQILQRIQLLLRAPGVASIEDTVCGALLEMTTTIAEGYSSWSEASFYADDVLAFLTEAFSTVVAKIQLPAQELDKVTQTWDDDDFRGFEDYRFDATDFFQTVYTVAADRVVLKIARMLRENMNSMTWHLLETSIFVLHAWTDDLSDDDEKLDQVLDVLFATAKFINGMTQTSVPSRVRKSTIVLLGTVTGYLQRRPQHLVTTLDFLFRSLSTKAQANHASRAILSLCEHQRSFLGPALSQFIRTLSAITIDSGASRHRVFQAVATLIQALPSEEQKLVQLQSLIQTSQQMQVDSQDTDDPYRDGLVETFATLAAVGRGLQAPSEVPIEIDVSTGRDVGFWTAGAGAPVQQSVLTLISESTPYFTNPEGADVVSAICDLIRSGFPEDHPSPFKFTTEITARILVALLVPDSPNIDKVASAATGFVAASPDHDVAPLSMLIKQVDAIIQAEVNLLCSRGTNEQSTSCASILDFLARTMSRRGSQVLQVPGMPEVLDISVVFALELLQQSDILPRKQAASFLSSFFELSQKTQPNAHAVATIDQLLDRNMAKTVGLSIRCLGGECARSEIDTISELLRKIVIHQPLRAKRALEGAVKQEGLLTTKAMTSTKPEQRDRFVAQVIALRGAKRTDLVAREFWIACKGSTFGYTV